MTDLLAARLQMAVSLGFHIIFAGGAVLLPAFLYLNRTYGMLRGASRG